MTLFGPKPNAVTCDPVTSRALGQPEGTVLFWVLVVTAVRALATAVHRTVWIARRLR